MFCFCLSLCFSNFLCFIVLMQLLLLFLCPVLCRRQPVNQQNRKKAAQYLQTRATAYQCLPSLVAPTCINLCAYCCVSGTRSIHSHKLWVLLSRQCFVRRCLYQKSCKQRTIVAIWNFQGVGQDFWVRSFLLKLCTVMALACSRTLEPVFIPNITVCEHGVLGGFCSW